MLAILFLARCVMGIQFQMVAALTPLYQSTFSVGLDGIGFLIGLYLAPGIALAFPGGVIGAWLGGKRAVALGIAAMGGGAALALWAESWELLLAARFIAGGGGVLLNVLMTKMVTDWFADGGLATAMGIYVNSWPVGIALALLVMPPVGSAYGLAGAEVLMLSIAALALVLFLLAYQDRPSGAPNPGVLPTGGDRRAVVGISAAGMIWGFYNAALAMVFSFGTALLIESGLDGEAAAAQTSLMLWSLAVTVSLGGLVADRTGRPDAVMVASFALFAVGLVAAPLIQQGWMFAALGLISGFAAGPIMAVPASILPAHWRAQGMGVFFTIYYLVMMLAPPVGGILAEAFGTASAAFFVGAGFLGICVASLVLVRAQGRTASA